MITTLGDYRVPHVPLSPAQYADYDTFYQSYGDIIDPALHEPASPDHDRAKAGAQGMWQHIQSKKQEAEQIRTQLLETNEKLKKQEEKRGYKSDHGPLFQAANTTHRIAFEYYKEHHKPAKLYMVSQRINRAIKRLGMTTTDFVSFLCQTDTIPYLLKEDERSTKLLLPRVVSRICTKRPDEWPLAEILNHQRQGPEIPWTHIHEYLL